MFKIRIADLIIAINSENEYIKSLCNDYVVTDSSVDFEVFITKYDIEYERKQCEFECSENELEFIAIYRKICLKMIEFDGFLFHAATIDYNGEAVAFAARSGVGKSTHVSLWQKCFKNDVKIINGDKPIFRRINGVFYAFGTPWCGKERLNLNMSSKIKAVCFIQRSNNNSATEISASEVVGQIYEQMILPKDAFLTVKQLDLLNDFLSSVKIYKLNCNMNETAALTAKKAIFN